MTSNARLSAAQRSRDIQIHYPISEASILIGRVRDIRNRHRLRRCRLHQGREGGSHKTARSAAQRPTGEASDAAQRNSYTHDFAGQRSECMLHEVGLSTRHEPQ